MKLKLPESIEFYVFGGPGMINSATVVLLVLYFPKLFINAIDSGLLIKIDKRNILLFVGIVPFTLFFQNKRPNTNPSL